MKTFFGLFMTFGVALSLLIAVWQVKAETNTYPNTHLVWLSDGRYVNEYRIRKHSRLTNHNEWVKMAFNGSYSDTNILGYRMFWGVQENWMDPVVYYTNYLDLSSNYTSIDEWGRPITYFYLSNLAPNTVYGAIVTEKRADGYKVFDREISFQTENKFSK